MTAIGTRNRRALCALVVAICALALAAQPANAAGRCSMKGSRTVAATKNVRVFSTSFRYREQGEVYKGTQWHGCLYRRNRRQPLWYSDDEDDSLAMQGDAYGFTIAGRFVAFAGCELDQSSNPDGCQATHLRVVNLRGRRWILRRSVPDVHEIVLKPNGSIAWGTGQAIYKSDLDGYAVLDPGPGAEALALSGSTLFWTKGGTPFSATLR